MLFRNGAAILLLTITPALSLAATSPSTSAAAAITTPAITAPAATSGPFGLATGLIFLLALVLGAAWLVKRSGGMQSWRSGAAIKVVAALSMGPRERVVLIELGGQQWLLGVTPGSINTLHHFEQPIIAADKADEFSSKLRQFLPQGFGK
jgi:flagellar protein FliO/FliZ